jgi:DNA-binding NarL/FixJ family response regulator
MIRVLLVDDHPVVRSGYQRLLEQDGAIEVVGEASSAMAGFNAFQALKPDVTISDISMPEGGGLCLLQKILVLQPTAKILICSMHDDPALVQRCKSQGASGFVTKNAPPHELVRAVHAVHSGSDYISSDVLALSEHQRREAKLIADLTPRELEICRLLAQGYSAAQCAHRLTVSQKTVANYQTLIKEKLQVATISALVHLAQRHHLIDAAFA